VLVIILLKVFIAYVDNGHLKANPAPSDYSPSLKLAVDSVPKITFGKRIKEKQIEASPGPCYNPMVGQIGMNQKTKISIKGRYQVKSESTPGPADYYYHETQAKPAASELLQSTRKIQKPQTAKQGNDKLPGPSDYTVRFNSTKQQGPSYSLRKRLDNGKGFVD
jgi:hypothetical protein